MRNVMVTVQNAGRVFELKKAVKTARLAVGARVAYKNMERKQLSMAAIKEGINWEKARRLTTIGLTILTILIAGCQPAESINSPKELGQGIIPASGRIMTTYNQSLGSYVFHDGYDIQNDIGADVISPFAGEILSTDYNHDANGIGKNIILKFGESDFNCQITFGHLNDFMVVAGQEVRQGQLLGHIGDTGLFAGFGETGIREYFPSHVHVAGTCWGAPIDIANYIPALKGVKIGSQVETLKNNIKKTK